MTSGKMWGAHRSTWRCGASRRKFFLLMYASDWSCFYFPCIGLFDYDDLIFGLGSFWNFLWVLLIVLVVMYPFTFSFISDAMGTFQPVFPPESSLLCLRAVHGVLDLVVFYFVWYLRWDMYLLVLTRPSSSCVWLGTIWLLYEWLISKVEGISILGE